MKLLFDHHLSRKLVVRLADRFQAQATSSFTVLTALRIT
jgi:hypothetical protein